MKNKINSEQSIDRYVSEISRYPLLNREKELALALSYQKNGDLHAAHQLIVSNLRFVVKIAHEYKGYGLRIQDLVQEGNIGLMLAVKKFEPDRGYRLISYAVWWIRAYIQNYVIRSWSLVKLGTTQAQRKLFFKLRSEREKADRDAGQGMTANTSDLATSLSVAENDVEDMEARLASRDFSLDAELDATATQTHLELLTDKGFNQEERYFSAQKKQIVRQRIGEAKKNLSEKEAYIVENRLMAEDPKTLHEIGDHFHISRERARQIESNVIKKIRTSFTETEFSFSAA